MSSFVVLLVAILSSGCLSNGIVDQWKDADLRVTSEDAEAVGGGAAYSLVASFVLDQAISDVRIAAAYRSNVDGGFGIERHGGSDLESVSVQANATVRQSDWARFDALQAGQYDAFLSSDGSAPVDGEFAVGLYWS